jgi:hypothetical protein
MLSGIIYYPRFCGGRSFLQESCRDRRINEQLFGVLNRTPPDLLGSVEDKNAYRPPKAVYGAKSHFMIRRPCTSIHDGSSSAQMRWEGRARIRTYRNGLRSRPFQSAFEASLPLSIQSTCFGKSSTEGLAKMGLSLSKMLSGANAFEISDCREDETENMLTKR